MRRYRQIPTIALLLIAAAPLFFAASFQWQQQHIQRRMKEALEEKMLHRLTLQAKDLHWVREGKELMLNDQLFDVRDVRYLENGAVALTGLFDEEESLLVENLKKNTEQSGQERILGQFFQLPLSLPEEQFLLPPSGRAIQSDKFMAPPAALPSVIKGVPTPPPLV